MKKTMILIIALLMTTLVVQANQEPMKAEFTVTQIALDAANAEAIQEETQEDSNHSVDETKPEGGATEEK